MGTDAIGGLKMKRCNIDLLPCLKLWGTLHRLMANAALAIAPCLGAQGKPSKGSSEQPLQRCCTPMGMVPACRTGGSVKDPVQE